MLFDDKMHIKVADFGFSEIFTPGHPLDLYCGTLSYKAPEIVQGIPYDGAKYDNWSLGVILYELVTGTLPFYDDNEKKYEHNIIYENYR